MTKLQVKSLSVLLFVTAALWFLVGLGASAERGWMRWAVMAGGAEGFVHFFLTSRGLGRSDRFFYSVLGGGMLSRLLVLGLFAYLLHHFSVPAAGPLLILVSTYFVCSVALLPILVGSHHGFHRDSPASSS